MVLAFLLTGWLLGSIVADVGIRDGSSDPGAAQSAARVFSASDNPLWPFLHILGTVGLILVTVLIVVQLAVLRTRLKDRRSRTNP